ncbi:MAG: endopeptidase La [Gracilibacteraceae bacterium]|nr:endopeptidase La [Gracilibacteraceae bacterium]
MSQYSIPVLPLRGIVIFPYMVLHLDVGRERSMAAVEEAMLRDRQIFLVSQAEVELDNPDSDDLYEVGTVCEIKQLLRLPGGTLRVLVEGIKRGQSKGYVRDDPYFEAEIVSFAADDSSTIKVEPILRSLMHQFEEYAKLNKKITSDISNTVLTVGNPDKMADLIAAQLNLKNEDKQKYLEAIDLHDRLEKLTEFIMREIEILELERRIGLRVRKQMEKSQKEYYLREQIKAIQKELGDKDEKQAEVDEYMEKIEEAKLTGETRDKAVKELDRLEKMPYASAEGTVIRTYLDWILLVPWNKLSRDKTNIELAWKILDEDHYGLEKVKERIIEFLAVRKLSAKMNTPVLCFVGPPGVGKTSLRRSVARAMNRIFVRMSLGGVRDEAKIRGHRRTYIGALPGRVIQGLRKAGAMNPVFMLDEIDKMASDFRGDPAAALLEVLDPGQNHAFADHYMEIPVDLSQVLFIMTANTMDTIPRALLDRMEVIRINGYTEEEKISIAQQSLLPKQIKAHGLKPSKVDITVGVLRKIIREYTREAGVRNLEREIANLLRKISVQIVRKEWTTKEVHEDTVEKNLGVPRFLQTDIETEPMVGSAVGLAYTQYGGDVLTIEVTPLVGRGNLTLTGKLGEIMKESAQAGWTFVRAHALSLGIPQDFYEKTDLHIHVPEGAVPKDGPSAGITMALAMASALSQRTVRQDVAMTGEITLRGNVLPVGGIKEKVLAAHRAGIKTVILPEKNRKDVEEIPLNVRQELDIRFVERMEEVLEQAFTYVPAPITAFDPLFSNLDQITLDNNISIADI